MWQWVGGIKVEKREVGRLFDIREARGGDEEKGGRDRGEERVAYGMWPLQVSSSVFSFLAANARHTQDENINRDEGSDDHFKKKGPKVR